MNITITGSNGFIGSNLYLNLEDDKRVSKIYKITSESTESELENAIQKSDAVINLAGVNRSKSNQDFVDTNVNFAKKVAVFVQNSPSCKFMFHSSSSHAGRDDVYGKSKMDGESALKKVFKDSEKKLVIERFPGIFGKNSKPFYNSVVATFCHNVAHGKKNVINNPLSEISLCYIDDVIEYIKNLILNNDFDNRLGPIYNITVGDLEARINLIANKDNFIPDIGCELTKKLHATFLYYKKSDDFITNLIVHEDKRGSFSEIVKTESGGQFSFVTANPGEKRGVHYHHTKTEKFLVLYGKALFKQKNLFSDEVYEFILDADDPKTIDSIPGHVHSIENIGEDKMIAVIWCNEVFDEDRPDTFFREIK